MYGHRTNTYVDLLINVCVSTRILSRRDSFFKGRRLYIASYNDRFRCLDFFLIGISSYNWDILEFLGNQNKVSGVRFF